MKIFTSDIPMESLKHNGKLNTIVLAFLTFTSAQLFQACKSNDTNRDTEEIAQLAPDNDCCTINNDSESITIKHNTNTTTAAAQVIEKDSSSVQSDSSTYHATTMETASEEDLMKVEDTLLSTPQEVPHNPDVIWELISTYANDWKTLMIIARSEHCNTELLIKIAHKLKEEKNKSELMKIFENRLDEEINEEIKIVRINNPKDTSAIKGWGLIKEISQKRFDEALGKK